MPNLSTAFGARAHLIPLVARLIIGAVFLAAGALKIGHPAELAATITSFRLGLPGGLTAATAVGLPPFEMLLGAYLIGGWLLRISSGIAILMLAAFIGIIASVVIRGIDASCGCFGPSEAEKASWAVVARDGLILIPAIYLHRWAHLQDRLRQTAVQ